MGKIKHFIVLLIVVVMVAMQAGCFLSYPTFQSSRSGDNQWYTEIDGVQYVLWPDHNWILFDDESDQKIGYLDTWRTSLYTTQNYDNNEFLQVYELGSDLVHVPLVRSDLASEFSLDCVDGIEWSEWGIYTEDLQNKLGENIVIDEKNIKRFITFMQDLREDDIPGEWITAGTIYCINERLPGVAYAFDVDFCNGILRCGGYNTHKYALIPLGELEQILGYKLNIGA